jgi:hypothetical protein
MPQVAWQGICPLAQAPVAEAMSHHPSGFDFRTLGPPHCVLPAATSACDAHSLHTKMSSALLPFRHCSGCWQKHGFSTGPLARPPFVLAVQGSR